MHRVLLYVIGLGALLSIAVSFSFHAHAVVNTFDLTVSARFDGQRFVSDFDGDGQGPSEPDTQPPMLQNCPPAITLNLSQQYSDPVCTFVDNVDAPSIAVWGGDGVPVDASGNTTTAGTYVRTTSLTDAADNPSPVSYTHLTLPTIPLV